MKAEMELFRVRYEDELDSERKGFLSQHDFGTIEVRRCHSPSLPALTLWPP